MSPTLEHDEIVVLFKTKQIQRGDLIGFYYQGKILLKRVIALPEDEVAIDADGNVYKSLHIQDDTSGIELKLNNNVGVRYKKGSWGYVRLTGLYLGNYRMMLSLGGAPSESYNKAGEHKFYANSNLELQEIIDRHVFADELFLAVFQSDYLAVTVEYTCLFRTVS